MACDTSFSDTPAHDDGLIGHGGCEMVQLFVGTTSHLTDAVPVPSKSAFPEALKEFIQKWGAPASASLVSVPPGGAAPSGASGASGTFSRFWALEGPVSNF